MSITATLIIQMIVFAILVAFTMKFVWPPITAALDERSRKIADGLSATEKAHIQLSTAKREAEHQLAEAREEAAKRLASAEHLAHQIVEDAKLRASEEAAKILAQAQVDAEQASVRARAALRAEVAGLAVKGAEQILRREVNPAIHAELLDRLQTEL